MSSEFNENNYSSKMDKSIFSLKKDISTLRTGRANINMLDTIKVDVYGQIMPIEQLATVSAPEARLISIQVWDKGNTSLIESAIQKSDLGSSPGRCLWLHFADRCVLFLLFWIYHKICIDLDIDTPSTLHSYINLFMDALDTT